MTTKFGFLSLPLEKLMDRNFSSIKEVTDNLKGGFILPEDVERARREAYQQEPPGGKHLG